MTPICLLLRLLVRENRLVSFWRYGWTNGARMFMCGLALSRPMD